MEGNMSDNVNVSTIMNDTVSNSIQCPYYGCYLEEFRIFYGQLRVPLGVLVCLFGTVANTLNIIVLCQKRLRKSPTNVLLTFLSIAQLLLLTGFMMLMLLSHLQDSCAHFSWTLSGARLKLVIVNMNNVCHTAAFAGTLYIALLRVIAVRCPLSAQRLMTPSAAWMASLIVTGTVVILCLPAYLSSVPAQAYYHPNCTGQWQAYDGSDQAYYDLAYANNESLIKFSFLLFSVVLKLIPCAIIIILITLLISSLRTVERRRNLLRNRSAKTSNFTNEVSNTHSEKTISLNRSTKVRSPERGEGKRPHARSRTTKMLITVVLVCVTVELPHGLLHLITAIEGDSFAENVYDNLGDVIEMLTLLYSSINFVIYCSMSSDFLDTFRALFCQCTREKLSQPLHDMTNVLHSYANLRRSTQRHSSASFAQEQRGNTILGNITVENAQLLKKYDTIDSNISTRV